MIPIILLMMWIRHVGLIICSKALVLIISSPFFFLFYDVVKWLYPSLQIFFRYCESCLHLHLWYCGHLGNIAILNSWALCLLITLGRIFKSIFIDGRIHSLSIWMEVVHLLWLICVGISMRVQRWIWANLLWHLNIFVHFLKGSWTKVSILVLRAGAHINVISLGLVFIILNLRFNVAYFIVEALASRGAFGAIILSIHVIADCIFVWVKVRFDCLA